MSRSPCNTIAKRWESHQHLVVNSNDAVLEHLELGIIDVMVVHARVIYNSFANCDDPLEGPALNHREK